MAVVNNKATNVSNLDREATSGLPNLMNPQLIYDGNLNEIAGVVAGAAGDSNNSVYRLARVSSSWRLSSILILCEALGAGALADVGLYDTADNGGAVVSQALFATGQDLSAAITSPKEVRYLTKGAATVEQPVWQLLGLSADPGKMYDLAITTTVRGANAANMAALVRYTTGQD